MRGPGRGARGAWSWAAHRQVKGQRQAALCRARQGFYVLPEGGRRLVPVFPQVLDADLPERQQRVLRLLQ